MTHMFRFVRRPSPSMLVALIALVLAAGGVAFATIPNANGTINGCYSKANGSLRVIDTGAGQTCTSKELALSFAATDASARVADSEKLGGIAPSGYVKSGDAAGGDLTGTYPSPTIGVGAVTNTKLANSSLSIDSGTGLTGGGSVPLGGTTTLGVAGGGIGTTQLADGAVTAAKTDTSSVQQRVSGTCSAVSAIGSINQDGSVACQSLGGQVFTSSGTYTAGSGVTLVEVEVWGAGGSGGLHGNGGGGATVSGLLPVTSSCSVVVGSGGAASLGDNLGVAGGQSSVTCGTSSVTAGGGGGGLGGTCGFPCGGSGGTGSFTGSAVGLTDLSGASPGGDCSSGGGIDGGNNGGGSGGAGCPTTAAGIGGGGDDTEDIQGQANGVYDGGNGEVVIVPIH